MNSNVGRLTGERWAELRRVLAEKLTTQEAREIVGHVEYLERALREASPGLHQYLHRSRW